MISDKLLSQGGVMTTNENESRVQTETWQSENPALLRAAERIIRLYDLRHAQLMVVKAESIARIIAQELNDGST
jgi:hypothetical protein